MKKSKKNLSDRVGSKATPKKLNPFEVRVNRQKYDVLGKKSKNEKGLPGISRSRSIKKRKATLLQDYKLKNKVNQFMDRRIGERDKSMTADDKLLARYTTERMKFHSRKSLYNLDDNEILTHRGESLAEIEKFDDPKSDDDDDIELDGRNRSGKLDEQFVADAHFGGGMLQKVNSENKSRKDLIDQMIIESKKRKVEKQKEREKTLDLTLKLDTEWKDVMQLVASAKGSKQDEGVVLKSDRKYASYDILSKELIFEARGKPTDKLKSEAQIAKEEKEKLDELEKARLARMIGDDTQTKTAKHRSADDLDDGFDFNNDLPFKKRKKQNEDDEKSDNEDLEVQFNQEEVLESSNDEADDDEEETHDSENEGEGESSDDDFSDLKETDSESEAGEEEIPKIKKKIQKQVPNEMDDVPFTLNVPENYEEFEALCAKREPEVQAVIVDRMIKSNHPSLPAGSTSKLITLFTYCLQHLQDIASDPDTKHSSFRVLDRLAPWIYDITQKAPAPISSLISDVIKEKYEEYCKKPRRFPSLDTLVFLKLIGILFTTSDYRHRLVTPSLVFMQHMLSTCRINSSSDLSIGLFITTLILEFTAFSKRITPEALNFLRGVLRLAQPPDCQLPTIPPFKIKNGFLLHVRQTYSVDALSPLSANDLIVNTHSEDFKLRAVNMALKILNGFCENFDQAAHILIMEPFLPLLKSETFPQCLDPSLQPVLNRITSLSNKKLYKLHNDQQKPKPLKLYEPNIEEVYTFKKKRSATKEKDEHDKLLYKYKKEVKGALREIRRDNTFLSKIKFNETKASDRERLQKVKEIFGDAAQQAGDLNKMKRKK